MTDQDNRRLDLRVLDAGPDAARDDAVMRRVLARVRVTDRGWADAIVRLEQIQRPMLLVAAVLAAIAVVASLRAPRRAADDPIVEWTEAQHVPSNAELLTAFNGYRP